MNDIEKLNQVINVLENESSRVTEFNGLLGAVNSARETMESTESVMNQLTGEQKALVSESYKRFEEYGLKLTVLESRVESLGEKQVNMLTRIAAIEKTASEHLSTLTAKIDEASDSQKSAIKTLQIVAICGMLLLAGGIAFLAKDAFI